MTTFGCGVPRVIYSLWLQGKGTAPDLVRLNFERWASLNPNYRLEVLDQGDVETLLHGCGFLVRDLPPQALSDIVRARLLLNEGGIWVDASVFPIKPLDQWLPEMLTDAGFFAFERPGPDRPISSWFLAATRENLIFRAWWKEIERFWSKPRQLLAGIPDDPVASVSVEGDPESSGYYYFWFHYLFQLLIETHPDVADAWDRCIKVSADPPHRLQSAFARNENATAIEIRAAASAAPVQKLNWRASYPLAELTLLT